MSKENDQSLSTMVKTLARVALVVLLFAAALVTGCVRAPSIIVAATRNAACVCRWDEVLGTLEVGKLADVLVVDGNLLEDLQALTKVQLVVHEGVIIRTEGEGE